MPAKNIRPQLCQALVTRLINSDRSLEIWDTEVTGFHIRKTPKSVSYRLSFRHPITCKRHTLILGRADQITFRDAKQAAALTVSRFSRLALIHKVETVNSHCSAALRSS